MPSILCIIYLLNCLDVKQAGLFQSSDTMCSFEIIQSYYFIMWCIWHEIINSSVQSDMLGHRAVEFSISIECAYSNTRFCQTQFMQEYPINKHEITIIVKPYLVKGD